MEHDIANKNVVAEYVNSGLKRSHARRPCVQLQGPLIHIVIDPNMESKHHVLGKGRNYKHCV